MRKTVAQIDCPPDRDGISDDHFIRSIIQRKVKHLIGTSGFDNSDRQDLVQDLFVRVVQSLELFDPEVGHLYPFVCTIVQRHLSNMVRNRSVSKRGPSQIASLNVTVSLPDGGVTELSQVIGDGELDRRLGRERRLSEEVLTDLRIDLAQEISKLPEKWQHLLERRKTLSMPEIAREMRVPRTTLNDWMRQIRKRFEDVGLDKYLES